MICDNCKRFFLAGNRPDGIPNGIKIILIDNKSITLCANCVIELGALTDNEKDKFFSELNKGEVQ